MISVTIAQRKPVNQEIFSNSKEGDRKLRAFLANLIREYAIHKNDGYYLSASDLPYQEKKQFLSHLVHIDDYEYFIKNKTREVEAIKEYEDEMQHFIDCAKDDIYHEDMQEMGFYLCQHKDNGECYYRGK